MSETPERKVPKEMIQKLKAKSTVFLLLAIIILSGSAAWLYISNIYLTKEVENLRNQIQELDSELQNLQDQLLHGHLYITDFTWQHEELSANYHNITFRAVIFNSGIIAVRPEESLNIELFDENRTLLRTENLQIGIIAGESYEILTHEIQHIGMLPDMVEASFS